MPLIGILLNYLPITLPTLVLGAVLQTGAHRAWPYFEFELTLGTNQTTIKYLKFDFLNIVRFKKLDSFIGSNLHCIGCKAGK